MKKIDVKDQLANSAEIVNDNLNQLRSLFPEVFSEGKVQLDILHQLLGDSVDASDEKYGLNWYGKRQARQIALTSSTGTLRPCPDESVDWETTQNLMIEGDNLEVLKLLQKSYAGKVKLIYIDPPYNTGRDFVYPDNFRDSIGGYLEITGQAEGSTKMSTNTESNGRFHTDWLNMIYPRIKLARNLLRQDGLICISIDDCERENLVLVCNEIFGEENFVESVIWKKRYGGGAKEKHLVSVHEYVLVYAKDILELGELYVPQSQAAIERYYVKKDKNFSKRGAYRTHPLEATKSMGDRPNLVFPIDGPDGSKVMPKRQWLWSKERVENALQNDEIEFLKDRDGNWSAHSKQYLKDEDGEVRQGKAFSIIDNVYSQHGTNELIDLFGSAQVFPFPKPTGLIKPLLEFGAPGTNDLVMDFFAGSATTAHAVMQINASDNGNRRFIAVQLPEKINPEDNKAASDYCDKINKPRTIAELTKERIRLAARQIRSANPMFTSDTGFRAFKLDTSNIRKWNPNSENLTHTLLESHEHILAGRTEADIVFELLLKLGLDLCVPMQSRTVAGKTISAVGGGVLMLCLTESIMTAEVETIASAITSWHSELAPIGDSTVVFRDSAFADDVAKTNMTAILNQNGLTNVRSL